MSKKKQMHKQQKQAQDFGKKVSRYMGANNRLLEKYHLQSFPILNFPFRKRVPLLSKIAMWILKIQGGIFDIQYNDLKKNK